MKQKKTTISDSAKISLWLSAFAVFVFVLACVTSGFLSGFLFFVAILAMVGGCVIIYMDYQSPDGRLNFFLYDRRRKKTLSESQLSFAVIEDNLTFFLSDFVNTPAELWAGIPKNLSIQLQAQEPFRPLVAYMMLHSLCERSDEEITQLFSASEIGTVAFVCKTLKASGDVEMADLLFEMKRSGNAAPARIAAFFVKNKAFFEGRMLRFVKNNLKEFMIDEE